MSLTLVSLLGPNIDEACLDLAVSLRSFGFDVSFDMEANGVARLDLVTSGAAEMVWLCGKLAVDLIAAGRLTVTPVVAPEFEPGSGAVYSSVVIASRHVGGLAELSSPSVVWAANEPSSWSGHHGLLVEFERRGLPVPERFAWTGSHVESIRMVHSGRADCAAIDRSVWRWANRAEPMVVDETRSWPSPPLCVSPTAGLRHPGLSEALIAAGSALRNIERLLPVSMDHLDPIVSAGSP